MLSVLAVSLELAQTPSNRLANGTDVLLPRRTNEATRFQPGNCANPNGRPKIAHFRKALLRQLYLEIAPGFRRIDAVCDAIIEKAIKGDVQALTLLRDTVDGKPQTDAPMNPIGIQISVNAIGT
jgi:hypothetical protein